MRYLLDTNACIRAINGRSAQIRSRLLTVPLEDLGVSIISKAEMFYGSSKSQTPERSLEKQLAFLETIQTISFDESAALIYGNIRAELERRGLVIGANDLLIAATAVSFELTLVTHNLREFSRIKGLKLQDWEV